jgi:hypothetical protein
MSLAYAVGDLLSTTEDLYRWNTALLEGKVVGKAMLQKAFTPHKLTNGENTHYGYGWFVDSLQGLPCIHHEGQIFGFITEEKYFPTEDVYVSVMTNVLSSEDKTEFSYDRYQLMQNVALATVGRLGTAGISGVPLGPFIGSYQADENAKVYLMIYKENGVLYADLSNKTGHHMRLVAETPTRFYLPDVIRIRTTVDFITKNGKITGLTWTQEKPYRFTKR